MAKRKVEDTSADDWISVREAAQLAGYHIEHVRLLIRQGEIKGRKIITVWQVNRPSLTAYLEHQAERGERRGRKPK